MPGISIGKGRPSLNSVIKETESGRDDPRQQADATTENISLKSEKHGKPWNSHTFWSQLKHTPLC